MLKCCMPACNAGLKRGVVALLALVTTLFFVALPIAAADSTVIGVDGTRVNLPVDLGPHALDFAHGAFKNAPGTSTVTVAYPGTFGVLTLGGPNYDDSVAKGTTGAITAITRTRGGATTVICYSQGADACTRANAQLQQAGYNQSGVTYWLLGNVDNADGGAKTRMNAIATIFGGPMFIPGPGVTLGTTAPTSASDAHVYQVSFEYDGFARAPKYPINLLADLNAAVGTALEHGNYSQADPYAANNVVRTTPDGKITDIMIPVKEVPLLTAARFLGLPQPVANILNPALKAIIDTGYSPTSTGHGTYPTKAVPFTMFPSKSEFRADIKNVQRGFAKSGHELLSNFKPIKPPNRAGSTVTSVIKTVSKVLGSQSGKHPHGTP